MLNAPLSRQDIFSLKSKDYFNPVIRINLYPVNQGTDHLCSQHALFIPFYQSPQKMILSGSLGVAEQNFCQKLLSYLTKTFGKYLPFSYKKGRLSVNVLFCLLVSMFFNYQVFTRFRYFIRSNLYQFAYCTP